jgi:hypothetical protein
MAATTTGMMTYKFGGHVKRIALLLAVLASSLLATKVQAETEVFVAISSVVWSNVTISSSAPTRIDNWNLGVQGYAMPSRNQIVLNIPNTMPTFWCNYSSATATSGSVLLSTQVANVNLGNQYIAPSQVNYDPPVPLPVTMSYWCEGIAGSSGTLNVLQYAPR